jgi:hypothetical protein
VLLSDTSPRPETPLQQATREYGSIRNVPWDVYAKPCGFEDDALVMTIDRTGRDTDEAS